MKPRFNHITSQRGFSLTELLVTVAIIGMLSTVAVVNFSAMSERSRNSIRLSDLAGVVALLEVTRSEWGTYPITANWHSSNICDTAAAYGGPNWIPGASATLLPREVLQDPTCASGATWNPAYLYWSNGVEYKIMSHAASSAYTSNIDPPRSGPPPWAMSLYSPGAVLW